MFDNFIENLCNKEDLIDIGSQGIPSQSSYSKWSLDNDEFRPISDNLYTDYAFHTDKEENPWWSINFKEPELIHHIIINNRKKSPFNEIANNLNIIGVTEENDVLVLHKGNISFGSLPESIPLILPIYGTLRLKSIKIYLPSKDYLHLGRIFVLSKKKSLQKSMGTSIFFCNRFDGFGERLRALLNTMIAADLYEGLFFFSWVDRGEGFNQFHSTTSYREVFNQRFTDDHYMEKKVIDSMNLISSNKVKGKIDKDTFNYDGVLLDRFHINKQIDNEVLDSKSYSYSDAFNRIGFSDDLLDAKKQASKIVLSKKAVAIHLRSGDIVYGAYRLAGQAWDKVTPVYVLDSLIKHYINNGYQVVIFGQDEEFCEELSSEYGIIYSGSLMMKQYTATQASLFDITLMSRCEIIVAGNSGFATISAWIGGGSIVSYKDETSSEKLISEFKKSLEPGGVLNYRSTNNLLKSFTILHFYFNFSKHIDIDYKIYLMTLCKNLDPDNTFISLLLALALYENFENEIADNIIEGELITKKKYNLVWLATEIRPDRVTVLSKFDRELKSAAHKGSYIAAVLVLFNEYYFLKYINDDYYIKLLKSNSNSKGRDLLINKFNELTGRKIE